MTRATGVGSLPGTDIAEALRMTRDVLSEHDIPYLPELPDRGAGADIVGRTTALLVDLHVDLQPSGWRFVDRDGMDARRTAALWRQDLDELAEAFDGYQGDLKLQVTGPWTLVAGVDLNRGERALVDDGAVREVVSSLAEGVRLHLADVQRLVPAARLVLQLDEPGLPAVLGGELPTASGFGRIRAVDRVRALEGIRAVVQAAGDRETVVHCCHGSAPVALLAGAGATAIALDTAPLGPAAWDQVATAVEAGTGLYAGCLATDGTGTSRGAADTLTEAWKRVGLPLRSLADVVVSPACGLAGLTPDGASRVSRMAVEAARELEERADE